MKVFVILSELGRFEVAVSDTESRNFAHFLEMSNLVDRFYIDGVNYPDLKARACKGAA